MLKYLLRFGLLIVALGWLLHVPVYEGYSSYSPLALKLLVIKAVQQIPYAVEFLGLGTRYEFMRKSSDFRTAKQNKFPAIQTEDTYFNSVKVRIYWPEKFDKTSSRRLPGLMFYHGGGCVLGSVASYNTLVQQLVTDLEVIAVSVEYRLAPEHVFPAAHDDCLHATEYLLDNADKFGVDVTRISLMGDSAGGNLAAAVAQSLLKGQNTFSSRAPIKLQVLVYPVMQMADVYTPSYQQNANDVILSRDLMVWFFAYYAFGHQKYSNAIVSNNHTSSAFKKHIASGPMNHQLVPEHFRSRNYIPPSLDFGDDELWAKVKDVLTDPRYSPLLADNLEKLPSAIVLTCENDVLRDEGLMYASRLEQAGVPVTRLHARQGFHGMFTLAASLPETNELYVALVNTIKPLL